MNKKYFFIIFAICLLVSNAFASTITYERTLNNLQVSKNIEVTDYNKNIILSTPKVDETEKVYDFADLFSDTEETLLYNEVTSFIDNTDLDMAIVTINDNPRNSAANYANDFYDYNYFGLAPTYDGLLFLIDMDTREMYISTTGTAQLIYDDYRKDRILDETYNYIANKEYYECATSFIDKAECYYNLGIPSSNKNASINEEGDYIYIVSESENNLFYSVVFSFIITLIIIFIMKGKHKTIKKATTAFPYMQEKNITHREDIFLTTHTSKVYDPPSSSSGSSRGGSSTHRGSSRRCHGGGGRRF